MRRRVNGSDAMVFGYVSPAGTSALLQVAARFYLGRSSADSRAQSEAASLFPQLTSKIVGGAAWSARAAEGRVEDRYFIALQDGIAEHLKAPLAVDPSL